MARPAVFLVPTRLWHPVEGWRTFPAGETDPGGSWHETEGGKPAAPGVNEGALKDLIAAQDQIEALGRRIDVVSLANKTLEEERDAANARADAAERALLALQAGDSPEVHDKRTVDTPKERASVEIPADWETLPFFSQKALAAKLTDQPVKTKEDVFTAIRAYLAPA